jgi:hypothetical protein
LKDDEDEHRKEFIAFLEANAKRVRLWPKWKRELLGWQLSEPKEETVKQYTFTAKRVVQLMNLAAEAISPSDLVSSHVKGELLALLAKLKQEEATRLLEEEAAKPKEEPWDGTSK